MQKHCWAKVSWVLICGPMSADAYGQMATGQCASCLLKVIRLSFLSQRFCSREGGLRKLHLLKGSSSSPEQVLLKTTPRDRSQTQLSLEPPEPSLMRWPEKEATPWILENQWKSVPAVVSPPIKMSSSTYLIITFTEHILSKALYWVP